MDGMDEVDIRGKQMGLIENMKRAWAAFREPSLRLGFDKLSLALVQNPQSRILQNRLR